MEKGQLPEKRFNVTDAYLNGDSCLNGIRNVLLDFKDALTTAIGKINELQEENDELKKKNEKIYSNPGDNGKK